MHNLPLSSSNERHSGLNLDIRLASERRNINTLSLEMLEVRVIEKDGIATFFIGPEDAAPNRGASL